MDHPRSKANYDAQILLVPRFRLLSQLHQIDANSTQCAFLTQCSIQACKQLVSTQFFATHTHGLAALLTLVSAPTPVSLNETQEMNELGSAHMATAPNPMEITREQASHGKLAIDDHGPCNYEPVRVEKPNSINLHHTGDGLDGSTETVVMQEDFSDRSPIISHAPKESNNAMQILTPFPGSRLSLLTNAKDQIMPIVESAQTTQRSYRSRQPSPTAMEVHPAVRQHRSISPERRDQPQNPGKVRKTKSRRRTQPTGMVSLAETQAFSGTETSPSQEDLLRILIMRTQEESRSRERAKAILQAKDAELGDTRQACSQLKAQLQALQNREKEHAAQISKYQNVLPGWKANLHKMQGYFKDLMKDHNELKTDVAATRKIYEEVNADKTAIETSLKAAIAAQETLPQNPPNITATLSKARQQIELMEQTIRTQKAELGDEGNLLDYERDRNKRLENEMAKISTNHQQMLGMVLSYRDVTTGKLDQLLKSNLAMPAIAKAVDEDSIQTMLDRCVASLREFQSPQAVKTEDLQRLNESIKAYADR